MESPACLCITVFRRASWKPKHFVNPHAICAVAILVCDSRAITVPEKPARRSLAEHGAGMEIQRAIDHAARQGCLACGSGTPTKFAGSGRWDAQRSGIKERGREAGGTAAELSAPPARSRPGRRVRPSVSVPPDTGRTVYFDSNRIASSSPLMVSGNMRWFISCWTTLMLWRYCHTPCGSGLIQANFGNALVRR